MCKLVLMDMLKRNTKRIVIDAAGYLLIVAAILTGWLPGPGGIPLALAGLGLLSINNKWAKDLRDYLMKHGGKLARVLFPPNPLIQWLYDILVIVLLVLAGWLGERHAAVWQISLAVALFFIAVFLALMNRDRLKALQKRRKT